jgi:hypothetical protein
MSNPNCCCLNCASIAGCKETSPSKILSNYVCAAWAEEIEPEVNARRAVIQKFGEAGAIAIMNPETRKES